MKKMIKIDIDDTILDLLDIVLKEIYKREGKKIKPKDINYWDYYKDNHPYVIDMFKNPKTYKNIKPIKGSIDFLKKIINEYGIESIEFVTSSPESVLDAKDKAMRELFKEIEGFENIPIIHVGTTEEGGISHNKNYYYLNSIVLEDGEHNVELLLEEDNEATIMLIDFGCYGWNQILKEDKTKYPNFKRVSSYNEVIEYIQEHYPHKKDMEIDSFSL